MPEANALIEFIATAIDVLGVLVIVLGTMMAIGMVIFWRLFGKPTGDRYTTFRIVMGRGMLIGLEVLLAADVIKTVALEPNFSNLGALGLLVLIRTFLSWTLTVELTGRWPWQERPEEADST